jgi:hypothetical protein
MPTPSASTPHMRCPLSSRISPFLPSLRPHARRPMLDRRKSVRQRHVEPLAWVTLAGSSPAARVRVRAAQDLRPPASPKHNHSCRSAAIGPAPGCRPAPPDGPDPNPGPIPHVASCHINSYPVAARSGSTMNPHTWGSGPGKRDPSLITACRSPAWMRSRALDFGELIRPDRTSLSLLAHGAISPHPAAPHPAAWPAQHAHPNR